MHLDLSGEETAALTQELHDIVENDRYPFSLSRSRLRCSPRIRTLRGNLAKLRPEPVREPLPAPEVSALPRATAGRKTTALGALSARSIALTVKAETVYSKMIATPHR